MTATLVFVTESEAVVCQDGLITMIGSLASMALPADAVTVEVGDGVLAPGLVDIQLNGGYGHDFTEDPASIWEVGSRLPAHGVTSFVPTVVTSPASSRMQMLDVLAAGPPSGYRGAQPLGVHFEGPFISPQASGAHERGYLRLPAQAESDVASWSRDRGVQIVTLAPELPGALDLTRHLAGRGVVISAGHSTATFEEARAGIEAGITYATHVFNAMSALGHREPGLPGAVLSDPRVTVGLIPDGIHVHPAVVNLVSARVGLNRLSVVTDATAGLGMAPGRYSLGGRDVDVDGTSVRLVDDGRLAGSALTADQALRSLVAMTGWALEDAMRSMTSVPASLLGLDDRGTIRVGARADLTVFTRDLQVVGTYIGGEKWA
jgi:N-acetylglucosamine-6-phosphate deacetylase